MIRNFRHTGIVVADLAESLRFYEKLGFVVHTEMLESGDYIDQLLGLPGAEVITVKMALAGTITLELLDFQQEAQGEGRHAIDRVGPTHIALTVDDVSKLHRKLVADGVKFLSEPVDSPNGFARVAFCQAPEGTFVELVEELSPTR